MRIMYLTQWFDPEPGVIKGPRFVRAIEAAGHDVTVVTGFPNYPAGRLYPGYRMRPFMREVIGGARVLRLPLYPSHDSSALRRALNYLSFFLSAFVYCLIRRERYALAYVYHPPITVGLAAALAGLVRRLPFLLEIQDLWPDTVAATGMVKTGRIVALLDRLCHFVYRRAAAIIVQSDGMRDALIARGVPAARITTIRNWADVDPLPDPETAAPDPQAFTIVYGGNLGRAQALATVVDAAAIVEHEHRQAIAIHLYGDGIDASALRRRAAELGVTALHFHGRISHAQMLLILARADALLIHLADDPLFAITIPSKTQLYLAMGRPIVAGIAGEAAALLDRSGAAHVVPPEDAVALARAIHAMADLPIERRRSMGRDGQAFYREALSFETAIERTLAVIAGAPDLAGRRA